MTEKICQKLLGKDIFLDFSRDKIDEMIDPCTNTVIHRATNNTKILNS